MKDFVKEYGKLAGALAAGAFLLSFLVGLLTRHPFGTVLLRALILAVIFGGLGVGLRMVVKKYLPEFLDRVDQPVGGTRPMGGDEELGGTIDIVLPEENPVGRQSFREGPREPLAAKASGANGPATSRAPADATEEFGAEGEAASLAGGSGGPDTLEEELEEADLPLSTSGENAAGSGPADTEEAVEEIGGVLDDSAAAESAGQLVGTEKDALPDISSIEVAPGREAKRPRGSAGGRQTWPAAGGESIQDAIRGAMSGEDPATLARAIRTVLKKDEKG